MSKLAIELGISGRGQARVRGRHRILVPPRALGRRWRPESDPRCHRYLNGKREASIGSLLPGVTWIDDPYEAASGAKAGVDPDGMGTVPRDGLARLPEQMP